MGWPLLLYTVVVFWWFFSSRRCSRGQCAAVVVESMHAMGWWTMCMCAACVRSSFQRCLSHLFDQKVCSNCHRAPVSSRRKNKHRHFLNTNISHSCQSPLHESAQRSRSPWRLLRSVRPESFFFQLVFRSRQLLQGGGEQTGPNSAAPLRTGVVALAAFPCLLCAQSYHVLLLSALLPSLAALRLTVRCLRGQRSCVVGSWELARPVAQGWTRRLRTRQALHTGTLVAWRTLQSHPPSRPAQALSVSLCLCLFMACRCLCYPPVLYEVVTQAAARFQIDVLGMLTQCRMLYSNFSTQWDSAGPSECPHLPMDVNAVSMAPVIGPAALTSKRVTPHMSWQNLLQWGAAAGWKPHIDTVIQHVFGTALVQITLDVWTALPLLVLAVHVVLCRSSDVYRSLRPDCKHLVTLWHAVYALLFGLSLVPQTSIAVRALFATTTGSMLASGWLTYLLGLFVLPRLSLYFAEGAFRTVIKPNLLLVGLRTVAVASCFVVVLSGNAAALSMACLVDLCEAFAAPLYATLVAYRLQWPVKTTRALLRASLALYVLTRVFQLVVLLYMVVSFAAMPAVKSSAAFILLSAGYLAYAVGSFGTVLLYRPMWASLHSDMLPGTGVQASESSGTNRRLQLWTSRLLRPRVQHRAYDDLKSPNGVVDELVVNAR